MGYLSLLLRSVGLENLWTKTLHGPRKYWIWIGTVESTLLLGSIFF